MQINMAEIERIGGIKNGHNRDIAAAVGLLELNDLLLPVADEPASEDLQKSLDMAAAERRDLAARIRELCALMQNDIATGRVTETPTRKMVMDESRRLAALLG